MVCLVAEGKRNENNWNNYFFIHSSQTYTQTRKTRKSQMSQNYQELLSSNTNLTDLD